MLSKILPRFLTTRVLLLHELIPGLYLGNFLQLLFTIPVQFGIGGRFYKSAYAALKHGTATMDVLVALGTTFAFAFSSLSLLVAILSSNHVRNGTFFETSTMLLTFITLGRFLENMSKGLFFFALARYTC